MTDLIQSVGLLVTNMALVSIVVSLRSIDRLLSARITQLEKHQRNTEGDGR